ncbi:hypothetical protein ACWFRM_00920 [Streptomyces sp. NPDC055144]
MVGDVAYGDLLGGRVTFVQTGPETVRMTGQFNDGFTDPNQSGTLHIGGFPPTTLDAIVPPGTKAFECGFEGAEIEQFVDVPLRAICSDEAIGEGTSVTA